MNYDLKSLAKNPSLHFPFTRAIPYIPVNGCSQGHSLHPFELFLLLDLTRGYSHPSAGYRLAPFPRSQVIRIAHLGKMPFESSRSWIDAGDLSAIGALISRLDVWAIPSKVTRIPTCPTWLNCLSPIWVCLPCSLPHRYLLTLILIGLVQHPSMTDHLGRFRIPVMPRNSCFRKCPMA